MLSNADIIALYQHFEGILGRDANDIIGQWPELKILLSRKRRRCPFETYTSKMAETPEGLAEIILLVRLMFTMSPSTAPCERGFSAKIRTIYLDARQYHVTNPEGV